MNAHMTGGTQNPKIFYVIMAVIAINMMHIEFLTRFFANKTLFLVKRHSSLSVNSRSSSIVWITLIRALKRIKVKFTAFSTAKNRLSVFLRYEPCSTLLAKNLFFSRADFAPLLKTFHRAKGSSFVFTSIDVRRPKTKRFLAKSANYINFLTSGFLIAGSRTKFASVFFKRFLTYWTCFHVSNCSISRG